MPIDYTVPESKRKRVIVDTDAACEADDPFAIAHALLCKKFELRGIVAEHFAAPGSMRRSYAEIRALLAAMALDAPAYEGEDGPLASLDPAAPLSAGAAAIVAEARRDDPKPLFVLCLGAVTNLARALKAAPDIAERMTVVWIGGHGYDSGAPAWREFNAGNDLAAANFLLDSGVELWQIPSDVYAAMHIGIAEIRDRIAGRGEVGRHLYENLIAYNCSPGAGWTAGESWSLGDSPAVGVVLDPGCGRWSLREAPIIQDDTSNRFVPGRRRVRVYQSINSRFVLEDFIAKLRLNYPETAEE
jgi:inosine-uridine nucleoside N-ribohydrolase